MYVKKHKYSLLTSLKPETAKLHFYFPTALNLFHWNRSDEMMMIVLEASETNFSLPQHKKGSNTQRLDVEIPRKKAPNCKGSPSISQMKDFEFESS